MTRQFFRPSLSLLHAYPAFRSGQAIWTVQAYILNNLGQHLIEDINLKEQFNSNWEETCIIE